MNETFSVEWYEHKDIAEINDLVEKYFNKKTIDEYYDLDAGSFVEFKKEVDDWIADQKQVYDELSKLVKKLPDDTYWAYEVDKKNNHVGIEGTG